MDRQALRIRLRQNQATNGGERRHAWVSERRESSGLGGLGDAPHLTGLRGEATAASGVTECGGAGERVSRDGGVGERVSGMV
ncbi:hypothetical protein Droror1_Dr00026771, partial [Drosera rotundifolia]